MPNPFNSIPMSPVNVATSFEQVLKQAQQNPQAFEEQIRRTNPAGYQRAMQIRNSANPQAITMQMAQARGLNPNILAMFGLK